MYILVESEALESQKHTSIEANPMLVGADSITYPREWPVSLLFSHKRLFLYYLSRIILDGIFESAWVNKPTDLIKTGMFSIHLFKPNLRRYNKEW